MDYERDGGPEQKDLKKLRKLTKDQADKLTGLLAELKNQIGEAQQ